MKIVGIALVVALVGCHSVEETPPPRTGPLAAWDPIDESFAGCQGACGAHGEGHDPSVAIQPGASVGDRAYCPVSGAVFTIEAEHPHVELDGRTVWFCCGGCADYFEAHRDEVLDVRGMRRATSANGSTEPTQAGS